MKERNERETGTQKAAAATPISEMDVVKKLEEMGKGKNLDWKVSIVDLLKFLDIDSSYEARQELATELGCPAELMGDSAKMNTWLHKSAATDCGKRRQHPQGTFGLVQQTTMWNLLEFHIVVKAENFHQKVTCALRFRRVFHTINLLTKGGW
jgi:hypothetical protein